MCLSCSFSLCPAYAEIKISFVIPGLQSAEGYKAPNRDDGHRLPMDAYQLDNVVLAGDTATLTVQDKSIPPPGERMCPLTIECVLLL